MLRKIVDRVVQWLSDWQIAHGKEPLQWSAEYCSTERQINGVDCCIFLLADAICTTDSDPQQLSQEGVDRYR